MTIRKHTTLNDINNIIEIKYKDMLEVISFIVSMLSDLVPAIKEKVERNKSLSEKIDDCLMRAIERWNAPEELKQSVRIEPIQYKSRLKEYLQHPEKGPVVQGYIPDGCGKKPQVGQFGMGRCPGQRIVAPANVGIGKAIQLFHTQIDVQAAKTGLQIHAKHLPFLPGQRQGNTCSQAGSAGAAAAGKQGDHFAQKTSPPS